MFRCYVHMLKRSKTMKKVHKVISLILVLMMVFGSLTISAFAVDDYESQQDQQAGQVMEEPDSIEGEVTESEEFQEQDESQETKDREPVAATNIAIQASYYKDNDKTSMYFTWDGDGEYVVYAEGYSDAVKGKILGRKIVKDNSVRINNMERGEVYTLHVRNADLENVPENDVTFMFIATKLKSKSIENDKADITYYGPEGGNYVVHVYNEDVTEEISSTLPDLALDETNRKILGLENDVYYCFVLEYTGTGEDGAEVIHAYTPMSAPTVIGERPEPVTNLKALTSWESVLISWNPAERATGYRVVRSDGKLVEEIKDNPTKTSCRDNGLTEGKTYTYTVTSYTNNRPALKSRTVTGQCVQGITYTGKFKYSDKLSDGYKVYKNESFTAYGYSGGAYVFTGRDGKEHRAQYVRTKSVSANYRSSGNYSSETAVDVATVKDPSSTWFIWASLYCQHIYVLKKVDGKWTLMNDWEISSGAAASPSPSKSSLFTTDSDSYWHRTKYNNIDKHHGNQFMWWVFYSGGNAFHSNNNQSSFGYPASGGCIRSSYSNANYIYSNVAKKSKALVY